MYKSWLGILFIGVLLSIALNVAPIAAQSVKPIVSATQSEGALAAAQAWIPVVMLALGLLTAYMELKKEQAKKGEKLRWEHIKSLIPAAHNLAQKAAEATKTKKDDLYLGYIEKLAKQLFGYELRESEENPLKLMGSAHHQDHKMKRDNFPMIVEVTEEDEPMDPQPSSASS